jgi:hypothetical protein
MSLSDYLLNAVLIALVIRQVRGRRLTPAQFLIPLGIVSWAALRYLHGIPTAGNDLVLVLGCALLGIGLGTACGGLTRIIPDHDGVPIAKATGAAAVLWVVGVGARMGFALYAEHGGGPAIMRFSAAHSITTIEAWVSGLVLMALGEAVSRSVVLAARAGLLSLLRERLVEHSQGVVKQVVGDH